MKLRDVHFEELLHVPTARAFGEVEPSTWAHRLGCAYQRIFVPASNEANLLAAFAVLGKSPTQLTSPGTI